MFLYYQQIGFTVYDVSQLPLILSGKSICCA